MSAWKNYVWSLATEWASISFFQSSKGFKKEDEDDEEDNNKGKNEKEEEGKEGKVEEGKEEEKEKEKEKKKGKGEEKEFRFSTSNLELFVVIQNQSYKPLKQYCISMGFHFMILVYIDLVNIERA